MFRNIVAAQERKDDDLNYHDYIQSEEWKHKAAEAKIEKGYRCFLCNISGFVSPLHAHHRTYERLGKERKDDLIILCEVCHKLFHDNGGEPGRKVKLPRDKFLAVLASRGITFNNDDPWRYYEYGKTIIQHIVDGFDVQLYDYYNKINIEVVDAACANERRREFKRAQSSEDWQGYGNEYDWRSNNDYWEGYQR